MEKRTNQQNKALHKYFQTMARECQEKGVTLRHIVEFYQKRGMETMVTDKIFKDVVFKPIMKVMYGIDSTTKLKKGEKQIENIAMVINKNFGEEWGVSQPFPSEEELQMEKEYGKKVFPN